ncbi:MAG: AraC family transcriptional regulator [Planctomycetes bacterium]|nr:AraC family transcriptional regulator [Planctomycetota bacterium]
MISARIPRLRIRDYVPRGQWYHVARHEAVSGRGGSPHRHDFPEVFWVERGAVTHTVNGTKQSLRAGDLTLIRPDDAHVFRSTPVASVCMVNVAFPAAHLDAFRARHFAKGRPWPWRGDRLPARVRIGAEDLPRMAWLADELARGPQTRLRLEAFLAGLLLCVERAGDAPAHGHLPEWLRAALRDFARPDHFAGGVPELARLAGRTQEHVSRVVRKHMDCTTTDLVNDLRLEYAARELGMSGRPILEIALDAGFENLSYFYRLFTRRFGATPKQHRRHRQGLVG